MKVIVQFFIYKNNPYDRQAKGSFFQSASHMCAHISMCVMFLDDEIMIHAKKKKCSSKSDEGQESSDSGTFGTTFHSDIHFTTQFSTTY